MSKYLYHVEQTLLSVVLQSYDDYRTPGLAKRDLALQEVSGCDSSECSLKRDSDRRRKTLACLVLGIGALGILAGIIAVIFIMIISRPPDPSKPIA